MASLNSRNKSKITKTILYKELSYKVIGVVFDTFKSIGGDYQEKYYQRTIAQLLKERNIPFEKEFPVNVIVNDKIIGKHFLDFLIDEKIILELKRGPYPKYGDIKQLLMYLRSANKQLGILAHFSSNGVKTKRIVNAYYKEDL
jgi:GxxExxY protein